MNLPPAKLLVFEDAPCGVEAAKSAGMRCIGVSTNGRAEMLLQCGAEAIVPDFVNLSLEMLPHLSFP
jgi:beta-phosphoglucomutase-like phosphatase (HAD superfamily)